MAKADVTLTLRLADVDRFRMFTWELRMLADRMRVEASPHVEALEHAIDRFTAGLDDEHAITDHGHDLPDIDGPREPVVYPDGCRCDPNDDGSWTMTTIGFDMDLP